MENNAFGGHTFDDYDRVWGNELNSVEFDEPGMADGEIGMEQSGAYGGLLDIDFA